MEQVSLTFHNNDSYLSPVSSLISHLLSDSDESDEGDMCDEAWCPLGPGCQSDVSGDQPLESPHSRLSRRGWVSDINNIRISDLFF